MKKIRRQTMLLIILNIIWGINMSGQALACNNGTLAALDANGTIEIYPEDILEGGPYNYDNMQIYIDDTGEGGDFLSLDCSDIGTFTVVVEDQTTNNTCWGDLILEDKKKPTPYAQGVTVSLGGGTSITVLPSVIDVGSFDNCEIVDMTLSQSTFTTAGTYNVVFTVFDASGNSDFANVLITVLGGTPVCNESLYVSLNPEGEALVYAETFIEGGSSFEVLEASRDNINFGESVSFNCDDIGNPVTIYVHVEQDGVEYNCTSEVMVEDKLPPIVIVNDFTIDLDSESDTYTLTVAEIDNGSLDNCGDFNLELSQTEFSIDDWGNNAVILTGTDVGGYSVSATATVTVLLDGEQAPLYCVSLNTAISNPWGGPQLWAVDFVLNNEDFDEVLGALDPAGPFTESFIAECGVNGGDPQTVYIQATSGQEVFDCSTILHVIDNSPPVAVAKQSVILILENGSATLTPEMVDNGSYDACTGVDLSLSQTMFTTADIGVNQVTLTVTDENGYENDVWSNVIVTDGTGCNLTNVIFPDNIDIYDDDGVPQNLSIDNLQSIYGYAFEEVHPFTTDECDGIVYSYQDQVINFDLGIKILRTWSVIDWYTNEVITYTQLLKLYTNYNASLACNDNISVDIQNGPVTIFPIDVLEGGPYDFFNLTITIQDGGNNFVEDNIITSAYLGQTLAYTVTDITTGNSCWGDLQVIDSSSGDILTFSAPTIDVELGASICIPINVDNFIEIQAGSGTILWDPTVISYSGLTNPNLPGVGGSLNELNTSNGELKFIWSNPDPANPLTLGDGEAIFVLCFDVVGNLGDVSPITLSTQGSLGFEWWNDNDDVVPQVVVNGLVTIGGMPCALADEDVNYPLANIYLPEFNLDPDILTPDYLVDNFGFDLSDVLITWPDEDCLVIGYTYEDNIFDYGDGSYKIARTITAIDWITFDPDESNAGIWTFTQNINTGIDPASLICDFLPRTAEEGDCESGHTLDDDVEWPADLSIADYRITPSELVEFSDVNGLDAKPSFYNEADQYSASYVDLLVELNNTTLVIGRVWTAVHMTYGFSWTYSQTITVDFSDFESLVTINTGTDRAMPGVIVNDDFVTNLQGDAFIGLQPVDNIEYEDEYLNGINILDLVLIQRHILAVNELPDFALLAADINHDGAIKASDLSLLRKYLAGAIEIEKGDWQFYLEEVESPIEVGPKGIYVGVKTGDVDDSVILQGEDSEEPISNFEVEDILLNKGEIYTVPVYLEDEFDAYGIQFNAKFDTDLMKNVSITSDYNVEEYEPYVGEDGTLSHVFTSLDPIENIGGASSEPIFLIEFEARENSLLSLALQLEGDQSYLANTDLELIVLGGEIEDMIGTGTNSEELSSLSAYPNPTTDYLNIDLKNVNVKGDVEISIYELNGQKLFTRYNNTVIDVSDLKSGMYYYQVKIDTYSTTGKFMVIR